MEESAKIQVGLPVEPCSDARGKRARKHKRARPRVEKVMYTTCHREESPAIDGNPASAAPAPPPIPAIEQMADDQLKPAWPHCCSLQEEPSARPRRGRTESSLLGQGCNAGVKEGWRGRGAQADVVR